MRARATHLVFLVLTALLALRASPARAYPWMIEHAYTACAQCHIDPSGGSALTSYGRAQSEILLRTHWVEGGAQEDPGAIKDFLFGALKLPEELLLQVDARSLIIPEPGNFRWILMQGDLRGGVQTKRFSAYGSIGVVSDGGELAWVTSNPGGFNLVARDYWVGVTPTKGLTVRAGRMNLPFGIRTEQHILYTRSATRTTTNDDQQLGLAAAYGARRWRAEVMGVAGNFHVSPDDFRERGYAGFFAWMPKNTLELGVSSQLLASQADIESLAPRVRQAHGVFGRWAPMDHVALMGEADLLVDRSADAAATMGAVAELQVDVEPTQGVHAKAGGEFCTTNLSGEDAPVGTGWVAGQWFFAPRVDVRADVLYGALYCVPGTKATPMGLLQLHFFL